jgi:uncharacterized membrane protein YdjX (TVP38/TMEM64 family)
MEATPVHITGMHRVWKVAAIVVVGLTLLLATQVADARWWLASAVETLARLGRWGLLLFVGLYVGAAVLLLPAVVLTLGGGAVFGVARGALVVWVGATLGATAAFLIGRYLARDWVERRLARHPGFRAIDDAVAREGWKIVILTRLSPAFPFVLLNYAFGVTRVSLRSYVAASAIGMIPGIIMYAYLGSLAGSLATALAGTTARTPAQWVLFAVGLLATIVVTVYVTRLARAALARRTATA